MSRTALDLTRTAWTQKHRDLTAWGTWWLAEDSGPRPCIVLLPTDQTKWEHIKPCVVTLDEAWVWSEEIGDGARAAQIAFGFAQGLGLDAYEANNLLRIRSIIADHLGDLLTMAPLPEERETVHLGEGTIKERESGKIVKEGEIIDHA